MDDFGSRLKKALSDKGISQAELAKATDFSPSRISQWIHNKYLPDAEGLYKAAKILGVSEAWLMGDDVPKTYDRSELEMRYELCELFKKCHGQEAYVMVSQFLKLDSTDRIRIVERINTLLEDKKYAVKKESQNA